ncbi:PepSY-associated TM helix domain-containing protein [Polaribacter cellanae]|uniref:PepSY domain-containing protein n=1 Tax=Polaribacter cellanae TaxID=2818493 RepID=A0A975CTT2_9FLAO|nr:PepSY-associated TM helix domain-containing protein [Polaribacter cellanae]QTE23276.1 PepSY domain-containing protein [Polaribacter cellanae]
MRLKKAVRKIHLWFGLASGLILSVIGITGSIYVFEPELAAFLERDLYQTQDSKDLFKDDIALATYIENKTNKSIESIQWPKRGRDTYIFKLFNDKNWYYIDQSTGKITKGGEALGNLFFGFILDLHTTLTVGDTGRIITGTASLLFALLMLTTGLYLWYPNHKGRRKTSFKIKWKSSSKRRNYDLHNVIGFYFFIPLFLVGITGTAFYFDDEVQWAIDTITFSEPLDKSLWTQESTILHFGKKNKLTIQEALLEMNKHYVELYKRNLWMTDEVSGTLSFAYQKNIEIYAGADTRVFLKADAYSGQILAERNPKNLPLGSAIMEKWHLPIHFGEFGGLFTRVLWFVAGFIPVLLTYTGFKIWYGKKNKKRLRYKSFR